MHIYYLSLFSFTRASTACKQKKKKMAVVEEISFSYKKFVKLLDEKGVLSQFQTKSVNKIPKIIDETIGQKLQWDSDSTQEKVWLSNLLLIFFACFTNNSKSRVRKKKFDTITDGLLSQKLETTKNANWIYGKGFLTRKFSLVQPNIRHSLVF